MNAARIAKILDPLKRAKAAHDRIEELQATVADLSRIRRDAFEELLQAGASQVSIANTLGITRSRVSQLMAGVAKPERFLLGAGALTIAVAAHHGEGHDTTTADVAAESLAAYEVLADAARAVGLDATIEVIPRPGNVHLNRPNLVVLGGPELLPFLTQVMEADPYIRFDHDETGWYLTDKSSGNQYRSLRQRHVSGDYGYLGRLPRPDGNGTFLYLAGIHAHGTLGAAKYLTDNLQLMHRQIKTRRFSTIVRCAYDPDATQPTVIDVRAETPHYRNDAS